MPNTSIDNDMLTVTHHGGYHTVTGSCHQLDIKPSGLRLLIDCGQYQGDEAREARGHLNGKGIDALILTHAHIDHCGLLPWLLAAGFSGPIYCTEATAALVPLLIDDTLKLQLNMRHGDRQRILERISQLMVYLPYNTWHRLKPKQKGQSATYLRLQPAGHILGSAYVELKLPDERRVVFSGDLGPSNTPLLPDPKPPARADILYLESTYGDKTHQSVATRSQRLEAIIQHSLQDGGAILIPAFSVGRTQELLFDIEQLIYQKQLDNAIPIILDSPMAQHVTRQYRHFKKLWSKEANAKLNQHRHPLAFDQCITIDAHSQHQALVNRLKQTGEPAIVVAASGMCQGGRIMNYLNALLPDPRTDVILAGYQAQHTVGRELQQGKKQVWIDNEAIHVQAQIHTLSGYSAHADQADLVNFVHGIQPPPDQIHLIHGEPDSQGALGVMLKRECSR
ncbi:MBL fold metallo-hydrolase RNA specificity domain-containing protein [Salinivibrio sp. SS2]|uniref:MBL fold metallo-hydrolase RNA specificity domain-containing protein n=1 Tax=Salinivibrio sp. SS2 TaxID=1892894 RepID=UPI0009FF5E7C|nr:MBL fold metallo-hydrolase [Salinivibrio sp. DV]